MAIRYAPWVRDKMLAGIAPIAVGSVPFLRLYSGAAPANCAAAPSGTLLAEIALPTSWYTVLNGVLSKDGTWSGTAIAAGNVGYWRLYDNAKTTCHMQGTIAASAADLTIDNIALTVGMPVSVTSFSIEAGNK